LSLSQSMVSGFVPFDAFSVRPDGRAETRWLVLNSGQF
jgi:hypothetical protein